MSDTSQHPTLRERVAALDLVCDSLVVAYAAYAVDGSPAVTLPAATLDAIALDITATWGPEVPVRETDGSFTYCGLLFGPEA